MQSDLLWDLDPPVFTHLPCVSTPALAQLEHDIIATANGQTPRLLAITGSLGVGKSTAGWRTMQQLGSSNRWGTCLFLVGDADMTPEACFTHIEEHVHYSSMSYGSQTPLARFQHVAIMRRLMAIVIDDADLLPETTIAWFAEISDATRVVIGLIGQPTLLRRLGGLAHHSWSYPPANIAFMTHQFLPQLSSYGWFLPRRTVGYAKVAYGVAEAAQGSLRRLYQILFHARWLASLDGVSHMTTTHVLAALDQRRNLNGR